MDFVKATTYLVAAVVILAIAAMGVFAWGALHSTPYGPQDCLYNDERPLCK